MDYGDILFAGTYDSACNKLDRLQVEAMRIVSGATARSNIKELFKETKWQPLSVRRDQHVLCFFYKIVNNLSPQYLKDILTEIDEHSTNYGLRSRSNIRVPFARTETYRRSFFPNAIRKWNKLPENICQLPSYFTFSETLKKAKEKVPEHYFIGDRWSAIQHARLRIGCSKLNSHLCNNLHVIPRPSCQCGFYNEDPAHFFLECPLYFHQRVALVTEIGTDDLINIETLLYGTKQYDKRVNEKVTSAVHRFIIDSKRFL